MSNNFAQRQSGRQGFAFQTRLANLLELPEKEYAGLINEIESDPIFVKLKYGEAKQERAIRSRRLAQTDLSRRFFELNEEVTGYSGEGGGQVENLLADKEQLVRLIQKIGEEKFKRHFIYNEDELSLAEIAKRCALTLREAKEIISLVNTVDTFSEFFVPSQTPAESGVFYTKVAAINMTPDSFSIQFMSAHWARGLYDVDYEKIEQMSNSGKISAAEKKSLNKLLEKIEFVNLRKSLMYTVISKIIEKQRKYLESGGEAALVPYLQSELARNINVHPSIISRAAAGRSIETPWGEEKPLKEFFLSARPKQKEAVLGYIEDILKNEKEKIRKGAINKPYSDKTIAKLLQDKYAVNISQRTAAKYRNILKLPGAFHRKLK